MRSTILIVDDDEDALELARVALELSKEWVVTCASDASAARERVASEHPDVILVDHKLGLSDGLVLAAEWAAEHDVIVMSAAIPLPVPDPRVLGVLAKPFDPLTLSSRLHSMRSRDSSLHDAIAAYRARLPEKLAALHDALRTARDTGELDHARKLAHRIRGTAAAYGCADIGDIAGRIEDALLDGPITWDAIETDISKARGLAT